uniref:Putative salivary kunitz domain protein n=1 Tax=Ixodes ricinus TaxID=34613 RepID=A0A0K8R6J6_IXORI
MQKNILWIFVAAAFGICCGEDFQKEGICFDEPDFGIGREVVEGWSYNSYLDKCYLFDHARRNKYGEENIFLTELACNKRCRRNVPESCYAILPTSSGTSGLQLSTYDPNAGRCLLTGATERKGQTPNLFTNVSSCERKCRDTDLRLCLNATEEDCVDIDRRTSYRYNYMKQTCEATHGVSCGGFRSAKDCSRRCGILVDNKCTLPIQNITTCKKPSTRYGYNNLTQQCEQLLGCADGGNSFESAKECWESCAPTTHRCRMKPDTGKVWWFGFFERYYFDIENNICHWAKKKTASVSDTTNLFWSDEDCRKTCKAIYKGNSEYRRT